MSLDLVRGKVVKRMGLMEDRKRTEVDIIDVDSVGNRNEDEEQENQEQASAESGVGGTFSWNPLLGELIKLI